MCLSEFVPCDIPFYELFLPTYPSLISSLIYYILTQLADGLGAAFPICMEQNVQSSWWQECCAELADVPGSEKKQRRRGEEQNQPRLDREQTAVSAALNSSPKYSCPPATSA